MKIVKVNLNELDDKYKNIDSIKIVPLSDLHIGDSLCNLSLIRKTIEYIKDNDEVFTILNGDLVNCALKNSKSDIYAEEMTPMQQMQKMVDLLIPIKHKILAITSGNHEDRIYNETSIDLSSLIAKELGIADRYDPISVYLYVYFGEKTYGRKAPMVYTAYVKHGSANSKKIGGKANALVDMTETIIADLYIMGHSHTPIGTKKCIYIPDYGNKTINKREMVYMMSNSFVEFGGYGEKLGFSPTSTGIVEAELDGKNRKVRVKI